LLDENTVIEIYASMIGGWRHAEIRKFFIVKFGETAQENARSGTRRVELTVENCRTLTDDEVFQHFGFKKNDLGFYYKVSDEPDELEIKSEKNEKGRVEISVNG